MDSFSIYLDIKATEEEKAVELEAQPIDAWGYMSL